MDLGSKSFRTIFEIRTPAYSLGALLLGLGKSIHYLAVVDERLYPFIQANGQ